MDDNISPKPGISKQHKSVLHTTVFSAVALAIAAQLILGAILVFQSHQNTYNEFFESSQKLVHSIAKTREHLMAINDKDQGVLSDNAVKISKINHLKGFFVFHKTEEKPFYRHFDKISEKDMSAHVKAFKPGYEEYPGDILMVFSDPMLDKDTAGRLVFIFDTSWIRKQTIFLVILFLIGTAVLSIAFCVLFSNNMKQILSPLKDLNENLGFILKSQQRETMKLQLATDFTDYNAIINSINSLLSKQKKVTQPSEPKDRPLDAFSFLLEEKDRGAMVIGQDNKILAINEYLEKLFSVARDDIEGRHYLEIDHAGLKKAVRTLRSETMKKPGKFIEDTVKVAASFHVKIEAITRNLENNSAITLLYFQ